MAGGGRLAACPAVAGCGRAEGLAGWPGCRVAGWPGRWPETKKVYCDRDADIMTHPKRFARFPSMHGFNILDKRGVPGNQHFNGLKSGVSLQFLLRSS